MDKVESCSVATEVSHSSSGGSSGCLSVGQTSRCCSGVCLGHVEHDTSVVSDMLDNRRTAVAGGRRGGGHRKDVLHGIARCRRLREVPRPDSLTGDGAGRFSVDCETFRGLHISFGGHKVASGCTVGGSRAAVSIDPIDGEVAAKIRGIVGVSFMEGSGADTYRSKLTCQPCPYPDRHRTIREERLPGARLRCS